MIFASDSKARKWPTYRMADLLDDVQAGFAVGARDENGSIQLRLNNVTTDGRIDVSKYIRVPCSDAALRRYVLKSGDILFNNTNSVELVGKSALFLDHKEPVVYSNHLTRLRTRRDIIMPEYLVLWLRMQWQHGAFSRICDRWIGQAAVQRQKLLDLRVPVPPLETQASIVRRMDAQLAAVNRALAAVESQMQTINTLASTLLSTAFSEGRFER